MTNTAGEVGADSPLFSIVRTEMAEDTSDRWVLDKSVKLH